MQAKNKFKNNYAVVIMDNYLNWGAAGERFTFDVAGLAGQGTNETITVYTHERPRNGETHELRSGEYTNLIDMGITSGSAQCFSRSANAMADALYVSTKNGLGKVIVDLPVERKSVMSWELRRRIDSAKREVLNPSKENIANNIMMRMPRVVTPRTFFASKLCFDRISSSRRSEVADVFGSFVIKPDIGSRSRGHIYFKVRREKNQDMGQALSEIMREIYDENDKRIATPEAPKLAGTPSTRQHFKFSDKVAERYEAIYHPGINKEDHNGLNFLCDGWVLQERISSIAEFRVFKGGGVIDAVTHRPYVQDGGLDIITSDWDVAVSKEDLDNVISRQIETSPNAFPMDKLPSELLKEASKLCPNYNSIDIGITILGGQYYAVIYEHSPQFSTTDLGVTLVTCLFRKWIAQLITIAFILKNHPDMKIVLKDTFMTTKETSYDQFPIITTTQREEATIGA